MHSAQPKSQLKYTRRSTWRLHVLLLTPLTLLSLILGGCGTTVIANISGTETQCPEAVQQLVDSQATSDLEISLVVDGSGSFMGDRAASGAFVAQQIALTVDHAVDKSAALRVIVFGGSAGNARTVVECPIMAVRHRNEAALPAKLAYLKQV